MDVLLGGNVQIHPKALRMAPLTQSLFNKCELIIVFKQCFLIFLVIKTTWRDLLSLKIPWSLLEDSISFDLKSRGEEESA